MLWRSFLLHGRNLCCTAEISVSGQKSDGSTTRWSRASRIETRRVAVSEVSLDPLRGRKMVSASAVPFPLHIDRSARYVASTVGQGDGRKDDPHGDSPRLHGGGPPGDATAIRRPPGHREEGIKQPELHPDGLSHERRLLASRIVHVPPPRRLKNPCKPRGPSRITLRCRLISRSPSIGATRP